MVYFRPSTETKDTILPIPDADHLCDLPKGLHPHIFAAKLPVRPTAGMVRRFFDWLAYRAQLRRSRLSLFELSDEQLRDIGLRRSEAEREAHKVRFHLR